VIDPDPVNCTHVFPATVVMVGAPVVALYVAFGRPDPLATCQVFVASFTKVAASKGARVVAPDTALSVTPAAVPIVNDPAVPAFMTPTIAPTLNAAVAFAGIVAVPPAAFDRVTNPSAVPSVYEVPVCALTNTPFIESVRSAARRTSPLAQAFLIAMRFPSRNQAGQN
jgi:hypothetical protein